MITKKAKWEISRGMDLPATSSDIITGCLRTTDETLSLWSVENHGDIEKAIVALSSNREKLQVLDYLIIYDEHLAKYGLRIEKKRGNSPYSSFNDRHWNIIDLNYNSLGYVTTMIKDIINSGQEITRVPIGIVEPNLFKAINDSLIKISELKNELLRELISRIDVLNDGLINKKDVKTVLLGELNSRKDVA